MTDKLEPLMHRGIKGASSVKFLTCLLNTYSLIIFPSMGKDCRMRRPWCMEEDNRRCRGQAGILDTSAPKAICATRYFAKLNKYRDQLVESIDSMQCLLMYQRCMFGNHGLSSRR
ncbi:hypothetical protein F5H01DRAFT_416462 [Linnemannia elongata]|nr:hypothetical protein F5H01DRAFT_416462 [Linnemannia elongata]